jgi:hypothetical protein
MGFSMYVNFCVTDIGKPAYPLVELFEVVER